MVHGCFGMLRHNRILGALFTGLARLKWKPSIVQSALWPFELDRARKQQHARSHGREHLSVA